MKRMTTNGETTSELNSQGEEGRGMTLNRWISNRPDIECSGRREIDSRVGPRFKSSGNTRDDRNVSEFQQRHIRPGCQVGAGIVWPVACFRGAPMVAAGMVLAVGECYVRGSWRAFLRNRQEQTGDNALRVDDRSHHGDYRENLSPASEHPACMLPYCELNRGRRSSHPDGRRRRPGPRRVRHRTCRRLLRA